MNSTGKSRDGPWPRDREIGWRGPLLAGGAALAGYAAFLVLARTPELAEIVLGSGRGTLPARVLSRLSGSVQFSVAEASALVYSAWLTLLAGLALRDVLGRNRRLKNALAGGLARAMRDGGVLIVLAYACWGFNYARPSVDQRAGWPPWEGTSVEELEALASAAVARANQTYVEVNGSDDAGQPTAVNSDARALKDVVEQGWRQVGRLFTHDAAAVRGSFGIVKRPLASGLMARFGISGVYLPFTGEPHVLRHLPAVSSVQAMAHEQAHQRGYANEAEASYMGYLANSLAPEPLPRYAAAVFATRQLMAALSRTDREAAARVAAGLSPGIRRDLEDLEAFWEPYRGFGQRVGSAVNDRYLKANRVAGGVASYGRSVRLLIEGARQTGSLFPDSAPATSSD